MTHVPPTPAQERSQGMHYQRLLALGSGGMANVHLSLALGQSGFKRLVVVKTVREELLADPIMCQMFLAEARLSARLNHPNVVQVSEVIETSDGVMLVMEYLDGLAFSAACRAADSALTRTMRLRVLCDVLAGLAYAHDLVDYHGQPLGIVHRDVSAQNVFLTFDGRVKLLDFGIAKVSSAPDKTRTGVIKGRVAYMPIEQVTGKTVDRRTDVYAVGCLMWEAIAGSRIWGTLTEPQIIHNVLKGSMPALSSRVPVDPELERIVSKATAHLPDDRYPTAEELRIELERYLAHLPPVSAREIGELLSSACGDARAARKRELAQAIANAERELAMQGLDVDGSSSSRRLRIGDDATRGSGISERSFRLNQSLSPTPGPFLLSGPPTPPPTSQRKSASFAGTLRPRRRGVWLALGLAAALSAVVWVSSFVAPRSVPAPAAATGASPQPDAQPTGPEPSDPLPAPQLDSVAPSASSSSSAKPRRTRPPRPTLPTKPASAAAATSTRAGCSPPYYFSAGIKTYKPECI